MKDIASTIMCYGCEKQNIPVIAEGRTTNGLMYYVTHSKDNWILKDNENLLRKELTEITFFDFCIKYSPKFGKFEVEEFICEELLKALLITKDLTNLFNTNILFIDVCNTTRILAPQLKEKLLTLFTQIEIKGNTHYLKFNL